MKTYIVKNVATDEFVAVKTDVVGFFPTTITTQEHADSLNETNGHSPAEVCAAQGCSMFGWASFNEMVERLS